MARTRGIVIAGTHSGCGKTSAALGLMAALKARGLAVQPFKVGPDFIDPGHHEAVTGRPSHNLDGWMCPRETVRQIFARHAAGADVAVVEGVMGLFDGFSGGGESGSTAEIAKWLGLPVLLIVDARSMARSAAALVAGFAAYDPALPLAGVVFNKVGGPGHRAILAEAMAKLDIPVLGFLPRNDEIMTPSRHLGLVTAQDRGWEERAVSGLAAWIENGVDIPALVDRMAEPAIPLPAPAAPGPRRARIGLARDKAFSFYYGENLRLLEEAGAELVPFSPLADPALPDGLDGLYLGGGYPELNAQALTENLEMRVAVKRFALSGAPVYAECGGFMYLMSAIEERGGQAWPMAGVFRASCRMTGRFQAMGYRAIETTADTLLGPAGTSLKGHEFHYSRLDAPPEAGTAYRVEGRMGELPPEGYALRGVLASYIHLHFGSNPDAARHFVDRCAAETPRRD